MSDEERLYALGAALREEPDLDDEVWDRLADGRITEAELAALRASPDPAIQAALAAFAPFDEAVLDRLEAVVRAAPVPAEGAAAVGEAARGPRPAVRRRWLLAAAAGVALAAGALFFVVGPEPDSAPLPSYRLELVGGDRTLRDPRAAERPPVFRPDSLVALTLRPAAETPAEAVALSAFLVAEGVELRLPDVFVRAPSGAFTFEGPVRHLLGAAPPGAYTLVLVLTPANRPAAHAADAGQRLEHRLHWMPEG